MSVFAVFGSPIHHSLSPRIHSLFGSQTGISLHYEAKEVQLGELKSALAQFKHQGGRGANITVPLKQEAFALCEVVSERAKCAQAVNTIYWHEEKLCGDNTDGEGLVRDLTLNQKIVLQKKRILILGAGGAVSGILFPLLNFLPANITIVNRTLSKAQILANRHEKLVAYSYENLPTVDLEPFDIVINATSGSLQKNIPPLAPFWIKNTIAIDLVYSLKQNTPFIEWANAQGAKQTFDGLGMLIEQAALAFFCWHNIMPTTQPILEKLRS